jgi:hypothetical protein
MLFMGSGSHSALLSVHDAGARLLAPTVIGVVSGTDTVVRFGQVATKKPAGNVNRAPQTEMQLTGTPVAD